MTATVALHARPVIVGGEQCAEALPILVPERGKSLDLTVQLLPSANCARVVFGSGCRLEAGVDLGGDQLDLLWGEGLPGCLEGWAEGAGGKDWDAVDQQFA